MASNPTPPPAPAGAGASASSAASTLQIPSSASLPAKPPSRPTSANSQRSRSGQSDSSKGQGQQQGQGQGQRRKGDGGLSRSDSRKGGGTAGGRGKQGGAQSKSTSEASSPAIAATGAMEGPPAQTAANDAGPGLTRNKSRTRSANRGKAPAPASGPAKSLVAGETPDSASPTATALSGATLESLTTNNTNPNSGRKRGSQRKPSIASGAGKPGPGSAAAKIQAVISPPQDALVAASSAKLDKEVKERDVGNISSLQKMISDIKNLGAGGGGSQNGSQNGSSQGKKGSRPASRNISSDRPDDKAKAQGATQPISIPQGAAAPSTSATAPGSAGKLKPDAVPFTPSFSPTAPLSDLALPALPATIGENVTAAVVRQGRQSFGQAGGAAMRPGGGVGGPIDPLVELERQQAEALQFRAQIEAQIRQQQEAAQRVMLEHQMVIQRLQAQTQAAQQMQQQQQQQHQQHQHQHQQHRQQNLPPRFLNQQRAQAASPPLYEDAPQEGEGLPPIPYGQEGLNEGFRMPQADAALGQPSSGGGASSMGINAGMLAGIAARAHRRTGSEMTPIMAEQLALQQQIEALQAQQRLLLQQSNQSQPSALSSLSSVLLAQQQQHQQQSQQHLLLQQQQMAQAQAEADMQRQQAEREQQQAEERAHAERQQIQGTGPKRRTQSQSRAPGQSLNDFVLPTFGAHASKGSQVSFGGTSNGRKMGDMGPPPVPTHARRGSMQTHRPTNSIIGSFGGFVQDMPDDGFNQNGGHHRTSSRSTADGSWRMNGGVGGVNNQNSLLDLNQAQAQLQMLSQFRAAQTGGGGHAKMASFSFPNMLPNLMMATTMAAAPQSIVQQQQAFQMQLQQSGQGPQRKSLFAPYLPQGSLPPLLQAGKLVVGVLRVNKRNRSDAYVATDVLEADIYICGSKDRNRALEGDIVAVELLDVDEVWSSKKEKEEKKRKKEENSAYELGLSRIASARTKTNDKKKDDVEVEGQGLTLFDDEEVTDEQKPTYAGHVVAVVERMTGQLFSGQLGVLRPSSVATKEKQDAERRDREGDREDDRREVQQQRPKIVWFKPTDKRVPLIAIPTEQAPSDFVENSAAYADRLFVALIKRWPITSLHPFGTLVEELGPIGDIEVETSALLKDCNFPTEEFGDAVVRCLPPIPWSIPDREYEVRRDMRSERVFTIDPPTAKDLDDALSVKMLEDGNYEVGVHIADVSFFVKPNTALDRDARKRATSVYLVQRAVPMLPPLLCEELCSLVPDVERLAFSVFFTMDSEGNMLGKRFERCIIKSCAKLAYEDAQRVIEGGDLSHKTISEGFKADEVEQDIRILQSLAKQIRGRRFQDGALRINNVKLSFKLDEDGRPVDCTSYEQREANALIEEFMLLANMTSAQVIASGLPEQALLRRHEPPVQRRIEGFVQRAQRLGHDFGGTSSTNIQTGFDQVDDQGEKLVLQILATKAMMRAKYFCAGMLDISKYSHFALNAPLYTHFTSPIRRYADVMVHRMLEACLTSENPETRFNMDRDQVAKCAQHCNAKKDAAKVAQEQSTHLHLCYLIHDLTQQYGAVIRPAKVVGVLDSAFDVVVPEFGIEKRVHADKMPLDNHVFDEHKQILSLYWSEQDVLSFLSENSDDAHLKRVKAWHEKSSSAVHSSAGDENASPEVGADGAAGVSKQRAKSEAGKKSKLEFGGLRRPSPGHRIQDIKEMDTVPVIVSADISKSPPVMIVYAVNPYATAK